MAGASHTDFAAYLLGVLDPADVDQFETHLLDCPHCQLDMLELYPLPDILQLVKRSWPAPPVPEPGPQVVSGLLEVAAAKRRRRRRNAILTAAAAAAAIIAGPLLTMAFVSSGDSPPVSAALPVVAPTSIPLPPPSSSPAAAPTPSLGAAGPGGSFGWSEAGSAVGVQVTVQPREWGSAVDVELRGIVGPMNCQLIAVSRAGESRTVTGWAVPGRGYGVPGSPEPLRVFGGTALKPEDIARFEVWSDGGTLLATVVH
ncbi:zf-HC2 domain-containing protein [Amycolatopsis sp. H20-H5]|uniref:zf-HC2 domain-containing protein n=1 Tax=Amycolatopsis sp. H20-H5 TaxID=3046309 RepID=UPI002DBD22DD|nr:zf-HC2 domain-containing protein [Amycolatopsis sp. H20-H5]MEC3976041.1 zf-HC2 domain-containing protein [Amycolatopsis sp. H20-H5]